MAISPFCQVLNGQDSVYQNVYFIKKGEQVKFKGRDYMPARSGFYFYRNCIYLLVLKTRLQFFAKETDIKKDSIYYTLYIKASAAYKNKTKQDTFAIHPASIRRIKMAGDRIMSIYNSHSIARYNYTFTFDPAPKKFKPTFDTIFPKYSSQATNVNSKRRLPFVNWSF